MPGITVFCSIVSWFQRLLFLFLLGKSKDRQSPLGGNMNHESDYQQAILDN